MKINKFLNIIIYLIIVALFQFSYASSNEPDPSLNEQNKEECRIFTQQFGIDRGNGGRRSLQQTLKDASIKPTESGSPSLTSHYIGQAIQHQDASASSSGRMSLTAQTIGASGSGRPSLTSSLSHIAGEYGRPSLTSSLSHIAAGEHGRPSLTSSLSHSAAGEHGRPSLTSSLSHFAAGEHGRPSLTSSLSHIAGEHERPSLTSTLFPSELRSETASRPSLTSSIKKGAIKKIKTSLTSKFSENKETGTKRTTLSSHMFQPDETKSKKTSLSSDFLDIDVVERESQKQAASQKSMTSSLAAQYGQSLVHSPSFHPQQQQNVEMDDKSGPEVASLSQQLNPTLFEHTAFNKTFNQQSLIKSLECKKAKENLAKKKIQEKSPVENPHEIRDQIMVEHKDQQESPLSSGTDPVRDKEEYVLGRKNTYQLFHMGFKYAKNRMFKTKNSQKNRFRCEHMRSRAGLECPGVAFVENGLVTITKKHNHRAGEIVPCKTPQPEIPFKMTYDPEQYGIGIGEMIGEEEDFDYDQEKSEKGKETQSILLHHQPEAINKAKYILGRKGKPHLIHMDFEYVFDDRLKNKKFFWRCKNTFKSNLHCLGLAHVENGMVKIIKKHNHRAGEIVPCKTPQPAENIQMKWDKFGILKIDDSPTRIDEEVSVKSRFGVAVEEIHDSLNSQYAKSGKRSLQQQLKQLAELPKTGTKKSLHSQIMEAQTVARPSLTSQIEQQHAAGTSVGAEEKQQTNQIPLEIIRPEGLPDLNNAFLKRNIWDLLQWHFQYEQNLPIGEDNVRISAFQMNTLRDGQRLGDDVINGYFRLLLRQNTAAGDGSIAYLNTFLTALYISDDSRLRDGLNRINLDRLVTLIVPAHLNGNHWAFSILNFKQNTIRMYDSMDLPLTPIDVPLVANYVTKSHFLRKMQTLFEAIYAAKGLPFPDEWRYIEMTKLPKQTNDIDCGIFMLAYARYLLLDTEKINFTQRHIPYFRRLICSELMPEANFATIHHGIDIAGSSRGPARKATPTSSLDTEVSVDPFNELAKALPKALAELPKTVTKKSLHSQIMEAQTAVARPSLTSQIDQQHAADTSVGAEEKQQTNQIPLEIIKPEGLPDLNNAFLKQNIWDKLATHFQDEQNLPIGEDNARISAFQMNTLRDGQWLGDDVINGYFRLLLRQNTAAGDGSIAYLNTFLTALYISDDSRLQVGLNRINLDRLVTLIVPAHLNGNHWAFLILNFKQNTIRMYDSMDLPLTPIDAPLVANCVTKSHFLRKMQTLFEAIYAAKGLPFPDEWRYIEMTKLPKQTNDIDCGIFMLAYARYLLLDTETINFTQRHIPYFRRLICSELMPEGNFATIHHGIDIAGSSRGPARKATPTSSMDSEVSVDPFNELAKALPRTLTSAGHRHKSLQNQQMQDSRPELASTTARFADMTLGNTIREKQDKHSLDAPTSSMDTEEWVDPFNELAKALPRALTTAGYQHKSRYHSNTVTSKLRMDAPTSSIETEESANPFNELAKALPRALTSAGHRHKYMATSKLRIPTSTSTASKKISLHEKYIVSEKDKKEWENYDKKSD